MNEPDLIAEITQFLARDDVSMSETTFGRFAANDGKFVKRLRAGRRIWPETAAKVRRYISEYQGTPGQKASAA